MSFRRPLQPVLTAVLAAALLALGGCASTQTAGAGAPAANVAAAVSQQADLGTFAKLLQQAGMMASLQAQGPVTVFAPSDDAFKALPAATLDALSKDPQQLKAVLQHHVVPGLHPKDSIKENLTVTTVSGTKLGVSKAGDFVTVEEGMVVRADLNSANGIVHVIDIVLVPPAKK